MARPKNVSGHTKNVLRFFLSRSGDWLYGYDIIRATEIASGTLYPMLKRLSEQGYLESKWGAPPDDGRPPRHMYILTEMGHELANQISEPVKKPSAHRRSSITKPKPA